MKLKNCAILLLALCSAATMGARVTKVLAIGNSFSEDAIEQNLYELAIAQGDTLIIGNAYIGGCDIERHVRNLAGNIPDYKYRKVVDGIKTETPESQLKDIISDEQWDVISLQQSSPLSGRTESFALLPELVGKVRELMPNKDAQLVWHMTWAYATDYNSPKYDHYRRNQIAMYDSIIHVMRTIVPANGLTRVVPSGVAIQNARAVFGDVLNRDGYHLSRPLGRYTAACTWLEFLTGKSSVGNSYHPSGISDAEANMAQRAANAAMGLVLENPEIFNPTRP